jgi:hypothetical protein
MGVTAEDESGASSLREPGEFGQVRQHDEGRLVEVPERSIGVVMPRHGIIEPNDSPTSAAQRHDGRRVFQDGDTGRVEGASDRRRPVPVIVIAQGGKRRGGQTAEMVRQSGQIAKAVCNVVPCQTDDVGLERVDGRDGTFEPRLGRHAPDVDVGQVCDAKGRPVRWESGRGHPVEVPRNDGAAPEGAHEGRIGGAHGGGLTRSRMVGPWFARRPVQVWHPRGAVGRVAVVVRPDETTRAAQSRARELIQSKETKLLEAVGERAAAGAAWSFHSHGAVLAVESPHQGLFDRIVVLLPRPPERPAEAFRAWAEGRLGRLDTFLERTNTGRVVKQVPTDACVIASITRRVGHDPSDPNGYFPPPEEVPRLLAGFVGHVEAYAKFMGDPGLRYVGGLRLFMLPRGSEAPEWKLGLDVLDTVVGRREETDALSPLTLVRGVLTEMAAILEVRAMVFEGTRNEQRARVASAAHYGAALLAIAERAGQPGYRLGHVSTQLAAIGPPRRRRLPWSLLMGGVAALLAGWLWYVST